MFMNDYNAIKNSDLSDDDKNTLLNFLELLNNKKLDENNSQNYSNEMLNRIFQIAKISPSLQIEMWKMLPDSLANDPENIEIFENVLDNRFGEYINRIDKRALVRLLNGSRSSSRSNR